MNAVLTPTPRIQFFTALAANGPGGGAASGGLRVVGNLPYNISTPILFHLLAHAAVVRDQHFMLQKEVIDRMVAAHYEG